jgi:AcrR family transcriptional regulator
VGDAGLRERKKQATRAALSGAAIRLARERGLEHVTADAIAEAVGVSPRTFHNYFANKEEAILAAIWDVTRELMATLRARPAAESAWEAVRRATLDLVNDRRVSLDQLAAALRLLESSPALTVHNDALREQAGRTLVDIVAERSGTDPERDLYPHLIATALYAALTAAVNLWRAGKTGRDLPDLLDEAFDQIRAGLPDRPR